MYSSNEREQRTKLAKLSKLLNVCMSIRMHLYDNATATRIIETTEPLVFVLATQI